ncbi:probable addiction module antidote protein [Pseudomonas grimontii]|uniref:Probable addiction module antidote protein n=1 Tax=Pseudomonas grimontii TaxID=129847 RepID=A0A1H1IHS2_9PSED|nr:addiction module antidote protein [Pseudomonas grimontii]TWR64250.1 putative addiction module antidote protein [Pseudomonas grimontii]SDR36856.1 probable addiction module antidote protein [Pseudomonas grimontii]
MKGELFDYDPAESLSNSECFAIFMADAFETNDSAFIACALGVVARAKGLSSIVSETGLSLEYLCGVFSQTRDLRLKPMLAIMHAVGLELAVRPQAAD